MNIRREMTARYLEALSAVDSWQEYWLKNAGAMQEAADKLLPYVNIRVAPMAGYEPRLTAFAESRSQAQIVCDIAEELQPLGKPQEDWDGNTVWRFKGFWLCLVEDCE
ncbi:MAG: hypothetical protein Q4D82_04640 [Neisseria sp.]|nr:hypothetical protein [Neisseria sp.]